MSRPKNEDSREQIEETLRAHRPRPSAALAARIEQLAESARERRHAPKPRVSRRRLVFALAAVLAVAAAGGIVAGELGRTSDKEASGTVVLRSGFQDRHMSSEKSTGVYGAALASEDLTDNAEGKVPPGLVNETILEQRTSPGAGSVAPITTGNRLADLRATLLLKVANRDQLSKRTAQAMKIARSFSGYVVAAQVSAPSRGVATSYLELKVPAKRSQEALIKISSLGKILSQEISLEDVQRAVNTQGNEILALKREIATLEKALEDPTLTAQARSQLQVELAKNRARLASLRVAYKQNVLRGRLATITLRLTTGDLHKPAAQPSRIRKAIDRAWDGLSTELSWAAMGIIVAAPFIVLAAALTFAMRYRRRREERRLLEQ